MIAPPWVYDSDGWCVACYQTFEEGHQDICPIGRLLSTVEAMARALEVQEESIEFDSNPTGPDTWVCRDCYARLYVVYVAGKVNVENRQSPFPHKPDCCWLAARAALASWRALTGGN